MNAPIHATHYKLPFYSKLIDWLEHTPQKVAPYQQWSGMLKNQNGIRKDEIERSGLLYMLPDLDPHEEYQMFPLEEKPTKDALLQQARINLSVCFPTIQSHWKKSFQASLEVKTVVGAFPKHVEARAKRFVEKAQTFYQHPSLGFWIVRTGYEDLMTVAPNWILLDPQGKLVLSHEKHHGWFPSALEAFDEMHRVIHRRYDSAFGQDNPCTLYDQYTFLGGNDYQEWFVRLPYWPMPYRDDHFVLDNLLIHIRTTERVDYDGRTLLMVEEIQSPWHAAIRDNGSYLEDQELDEDDERIADAPFGKEWHELAIKATIWLAVHKGHSHIGFTTGKQQCQRWGELEGLMNLYDIDVPKCLKKIAAQFDCANDWTTIVTRKPDGRIGYEGEGRWVVKDCNDKPLTSPLKNKDVALFFLNQRSTPVKEQIRLLRVSPELKQAVSSSNIPLFGW